MKYIQRDLVFSHAVFILLDYIILAVSSVEKSRVTFWEPECVRYGCHSNVAQRRVAYTINVCFIYKMAGSSLSVMDYLYWSGLWLPAGWPVVQAAFLS